MSLNVASVQTALQHSGVDGWLLYDFRGINLLAARITGVAGLHRTRRWFYLIPANGDPIKLVHRIESEALDHLPGIEKRVYLRWQELEDQLGQVLSGSRRIAMEYSPRNNNPYVSRVDAGTVELIRSYGVEVVSSGDLIQQFEATWDDSQWAMHREAATHTDSAFRAAWTFIADRIRAKGSTTELDVQSRIMEHFAQHDLVTDSPPIVAVWEHAADPHFSPSKATNKSIEKGSFVLIDLWAKLNRPRAVYSDLTRVAYVGDEAPLDVQRIFAIVREARDAAIERVRQALGSHQVVQGWQVDAAARAVIERAGYGDAFTHRTGHSIGEETHGNGANIDGLETKEDRTILRQTGFSIEPGIYLPGQFGIRSEVNVYIDAEGQVHVTGGIPQTEVQRIAVE